MPCKAPLLNLLTLSPSEAPFAKLLPFERVIALKTKVIIQHTVFVSHYGKLIDCTIIFIVVGNAFQPITQIKSKALCSVGS